MKNIPVTKEFPIVAIGCSAGGLEAVIEILNFLTPDWNNMPMWPAMTCRNHLGRSRPSQIS